MDRAGAHNATITVAVTFPLMIGHDWQVDRALGAEYTQASGKGTASSAANPPGCSVRRTRACNLPTLYMLVPHDGRRNAIQSNHAGSRQAGTRHLGRSRD